MPVPEDSTEVVLPAVVAPFKVGALQAVFPVDDDHCAIGYHSSLPLALALASKRNCNSLESAVATVRPIFTKMRQPSLVETSTGLPTVTVADACCVSESKACAAVL